MITGVFAVTGTATMVNVAELVPFATVTLMGTVAEALFDNKVTV